MTTEAAFLQAILEQPAEDASWLVLADWLEEDGQSERSELVRLQVHLRREAHLTTRKPLEKRVQKLLAAGAVPPVATCTNSLGMELALVPAGLYWMGSRVRRPPADEDEFPHHLVEITRPFYLGVHHVSQEQYEQVMGTNPSFFGPKGEGRSQVQHLDTRQLPVEMVSYYDIEEFCRRLSARRAEKKAGHRYRLPTEAEWEYACRAGICHTAYHFGHRLTMRAARFGGNGGGHPRPAGSHRANLFGLHDLHGNIWEWCEDWYDERYYARSPQTDPPGPAAGHRRVLRGGGWSTPAYLCRSALRGHNTLDARHNYNGFRVALSVSAA